MPQNLINLLTNQLTYLCVLINSDEFINNSLSGKIERENSLVSENRNFIYIINKGKKLSSKYGISCHNKISIKETLEGFAFSNYIYVLQIGIELQFNDDIIDSIQVVKFHLECL